MKRNNLIFPVLRPLDFLLNLIFPEICIACGDALVKGEQTICIFCLMKMPETDMFPEAPHSVLKDKFLGKVNCSGAAAMYWFEKESSIQKLVHALKYKNQPEIGLKLGRIMGDRLTQTPWLHNYLSLIPVPLHPVRKLKRGYNQAEKIAQGISDITGISVRNDILLRAENNITQTGKSKSDRWDNVKSIFKCQPHHAHPVILVDDILTTGATLEACILALNQQGFQDVMVVTLGAARKEFS
jgi:ComF family protein